MKKCALCSVNAADLIVKQVVDGAVRELAVCKACAGKQGIQSPLSVADFLSTMGPAARQGRETMPKQPSCPACHMTWADFKKSERLGCASCYATFEAHLLPVIEDMHRATEHCGRRPEREARQAEVARLKQELQAAVERQDFETAAGIRDQIREREAGVAGKVPHG